MKRTRRPAALRRSAGLTLIEIMTTIGIVALVAVVTLPSIGNLDDDDLQAGSEAIMQSLAFARGLAIDRGHYGVLFSEDDDTLKVFRLDVTTNPPTQVFDVLNPHVKAPYEIDLRDLYDIDLTKVEFDAPGNDNQLDVVFNPDGTPVVSDDLGTITNVDFEYEFDGNQHTITVDPVSGRITRP